MKKSDQSLKVIVAQFTKCAKKVHENLGNGFDEKIYIKALKGEIKEPEKSKKKKKIIPKEINDYKIIDIAECIQIKYRSEKIGDKKFNYILEEENPITGCIILFNSFLFFLFLNTYLQFKKVQPR